MAKRVKADVREGRDRDRPRRSCRTTRSTTASTPSGKTKDLYAPDYDAFLWDWDVERHDAHADHGGAALEQRLERLVLREQGVRQGADRSTYGDAARTRRSRRCATPRPSRSKRPAVPAARAPERRRARTASTPGTAGCPRRRPSGRPLFEVAQQILALKTRAAAARPRTAAPAAATVERRRGLADDAALRADRLGAHLARDHRIVVHRERAQEDRAARVD